MANHTVQNTGRLGQKYMAKFSPKTMRLFYAACLNRRRLSCSFSSDLLSRSFASGRLAGCLLRASHWRIYPCIIKVITFMRFLFGSLSYEYFLQQFRKDLRLKICWFLFSYNKNLKFLFKKLQYFRAYWFMSGIVLI